MTQSPTPALNKALIAAQAEMKNAAFNRRNPHHGNNYADLAAVRDATVDALARYGLAITQQTEYRDGEFLLVTTLLHESGEFREAVWPLPKLGEEAMVIVKGQPVRKFIGPQDIGGNLTYGRRYTWSAICGISSEEDDDAEHAQGNTPSRQPPQHPRQDAHRQQQPPQQPPQQQAQADRGAAFEDDVTLHDPEGNPVGSFREVKDAMRVVRAGLPRIGSLTRLQSFFEHNADLWAAIKEADGAAHKSIMSDINAKKKALQEEGGGEPGKPLPEGSTDGVKKIAMSYKADGSADVPKWKGAADKALPGYSDAQKLAFAAMHKEELEQVAEVMPAWAKKMREACGVPA